MRPLWEHLPRVPRSGVYTVHFSTSERGPGLTYAALGKTPYALDLRFKRLRNITPFNDETVSWRPETAASDAVLRVSVTGSGPGVT